MTSGSDEFSTAEILANKPPRRRIPRSALLIATTALAVVTGAGVATAAAFSPAPSPTPTTGDTATPSATPSDTAPGQDRGRGHRMGFGGPSIHGEFVVPDGEGKYVTVATQYGDVTAVGQDSITVKSEDGYTKEYTINGDTRINRRGEDGDAVKAGQKVMVMAKVDGSTATAVAIHDATTRDGQGRHGKGGHWYGKGDRPHRDHQSGQPSTPSPTPTS
ncbi:hypothetical protein [Streptosporangium amethystogenes]|uniref:hypothetical protein n=1 Tax=Streptosporangium amethystogenes TaxID=2002 RepID=UPI0012F8F651|nr:hypothetical protein [Streptosporangium amethystogenes]